MATSIPTVARGSLRPSLELVWTHADETEIEDLTDAVIVGRIKDLSDNTYRTVAGDLTPLAPETDGVFEWVFDASDVATEGVFEVQFAATWPDDPTYGRTIVFAWEVSASLTAPDDAGTVVDIDGCVSLPNRTTNPTTPTTGYRLFMKNGVLSLIDSAGTVTAV
jgi:hypothetical protein